MEKPPEVNEFSSDTTSSELYIKQVYGTHTVSFSKFL